MANQGSSGASCGTFDTMEVRPWSEPRHENSKEIALARSLPQIAVGLNSIDAANHANLRVKAFADQISAQSFRIHANSWADTLLYTAGASWLEVSPDDHEVQFGQFNTQGDHPWDKPQLKTSRQIRFARPYTVAPKVIVWLNSLDMSNAHNVRINANATDITSAGFTLHLDTWADSILFSAGATWIAVPSDRPHFSTGSFNSQEIRPWDKPQLNHNKSVSFAAASYQAVPRVLTGLNTLDFDYRRNLRIKMVADGVTAAGMMLHLDSWADSVMYSAGGSYLAIG